ncbi:hypothetical protein quinque_000455 [Culex quinquefasciatus]|uniref:uncharacterized protein LOC6048229 n=1 Tax=Culex quinquefasciatus TaxID=7176 RepID=UPI0018E2D51D|nr:uncharacterized protein LOC6048229 [Culex quinquefasciatus]
MAPIVDNNQFELPAVETPGKKRRRNADTNPFLSSSFSDQTFNIPSSTPIHNRPVDGSAFENPSFRYGGGHNKENYNVFSDSCMEVKSIAELANGTGENPFEVVRKPPTKRKKINNNFEESCFVNPGLNLQAADKPTVNPFEIVRSEDAARRENESCFVNGALNIKGKDNVGERVNPFEITRPVETGVGNEKAGVAAEELKGIENPGLEMQTYALAVPFTPSINHRINFQELPASALTPCQMLAKNLVFSPEPTGTAEGNLITPKRNATVTKRKSLSVISEEPLDIGEELDCYQLELENSMNEAKARRQVTNGPAGSIGVKRKTRRSLIDVKHISNLSMKLKQLEDSDEEEAAKDPEPEEELAKVIEEPPQQVPAQTTFTVVKETTIKEEIRIDITNPDVQFEEVDDFEDEEQDVDLFANPAPFQRAYRKKEDPVEFKQPTPLPDLQPTTKGSKVKDAIRRSFRKLIHPKANQPQVTDLDEKPKEGLISTIRHSLRRKTGNKPKHLEEETLEDYDDPEPTPNPGVLEMSIIAEAPRTVFRQPATGEYKPISSGATGSGPSAAGSLLRSSLRRSTKDVKRHMMKSVFKKEEAK